MKRRTFWLLTVAATLNLAPALNLAHAQTAPAAPVIPPAAPAAPAAPVTPPAPAAPAPRAAPARTVTAPAANYVALGTYYYEQGDYDNAYIAFRAASEQDPRNAAALLGLGRTQGKLRLFSASIETLRRLISVDARNVSPYIALAQAYQAQYIGTSDRAAVRSNLDDALRILTDAETTARAAGGSALNINLSKVYNERGYVYRLSGNTQGAIDAFRQASALNPDNGVILFNLGDMYALSGNTTAAIDSLQRAVVADPRDSYSRAYYAKLLALSGNSAAAKPEAAQAARLNPTNAYAVGQYGVVSYLAKDSATAAAQLSAAIKLDPLRYPEFYYYRGRLELDQGQLREARSDLTKSAALASSNPEYLYYLGLAYERGAGTIAPDKVTARTNYEKALALLPAYKLAQDGLTRIK